jgi:RNA polymerase sigma-70 factor, ECF subfamily
VEEQRTVSINERPARERATFAALVERFQQPLGAYLLHLSGDLDLALALTRETFVRWYAMQAECPTGVSQRAWLYRIATGVALSQLRVADADATWRSPPRSTPAAYPPSSIALGTTNAERGLVQSALGGLRPGDRAVLLVCDLEQFPPTDAAAILGVSGQALCQRLARARAAFRLAYVDACRSRD